MDLKLAAEKIKKVDSRFKVTIWEKFGKRNIYVDVGRTGKKVTVHFTNKKIYWNRPGARTEAVEIGKVLRGFTVVK